MSTFDIVHSRVGFDRVGGVRVETSWIGADSDAGERAGLFETTVESADGVLDRRRYSTFVEARAGHDDAVRAARRRVRTETWRTLRTTEAAGSGALGLW